MEPNYCDPFNTGAWMHQYAALQERQRASQEADNVPADQAGFEQQLSDLHLRSSDESSAEGSSPDAGSPVARPAEAHGRIQRTDVGGSMRLPSPFNTRDNWLNNTRYSVDLPRARSSSGDAPPSDLQDGLFSSTRYTAPSELQPVARTKKKKSRGLWSRFKSVVGGKAFGGSRGKKSPSGSASDVDISTEFQVYYAKRGREIEPYEDDEQLISIFRSAAERDRMNPRTVANIASHLRNLSAYLRQNEMAPMADRVNNDSLDADAARYASTNPSIIGALRKLRAACAGQTIDFAKRDREIEPYEDDEQLISIFRSAAEQDRGNPSTVRNTVGHLRNFGAYLRQNEMTPMADRVNEESLDEDAASYACTNPNIVGALRRLRAAYAGQPIDFTRRGRELQPHEEDEQLISIFRSAADRDGMTPGTVTNIASHLRNLSAYLRQNDRAPMIGRINDGSLDADVASYGNRDIAGALRKLRAAYAGQPIDFKRGRGVVVGLHSEDAELLGRFEAAVRRAQVPTETIKRNLRHLKNLANWLFENDKAPLASRFRGESINNDILEYRDKGGDPSDRLRSALTHLRRLGPGEEIEQLGPGPRVMGPRTLDPYPDDARLIEDATRQALHDLGKSTSRQRMPTNDRASRLRGLSDWLRREQREPIAGRVNGSERQQSELQKDARDYAGATNNWHLRRDLNELRKYEQLVEANQALGLHPPEQADWPWGPAESQAGSFDQEQLWREVDQAGRQAPAGWDHPWSGPSSQSDQPAGSQTVSYDQEQLWHEADQAGGQAPAGWDHPWSGPSSQPDQPAGSQTVSYDQEQLWHEADQAGGQAPAGWDHPWSGPSSRSDQPAGSQTVSYDPAEAVWATLTGLAGQSSAHPSSDFFRGVGYPVNLPSTPQELRDDAHYAPAFPSTTSDASKAPPPDRSGRVLDTREWLGDQHILRDYELLMQDLQRNNPDLAARTRLVDPLVAHYHLRLGSASVTLAAFQRIVEVNGNDTADFLFVPVNNASASDPVLRGTHWSLLFVDRRDREIPVAYHYDSNRGQNGERAAMLAQRLSARLEPVRMTQQRNDYDCGVFVLDGTRALVRRLAQRRRPAVLHLNNLVADRLALRNRLRG